MIPPTNQAELPTTLVTVSPSRPPVHDSATANCHPRASNNRPQAAAHSWAEFSDSTSPSMIIRSYHKIGGVASAVWTPWAVAAAGAARRYLGSLNPQPGCRVLL